MFTTATQVVIDREINRLAPGAVDRQANGYTYIDGSMITSQVSPILARAILISRLVRPGIGTTEEFVQDVDVNKIFQVTVEMENTFDMSTRTIGENGTAGNNGLINMAPHLIPSTTPFHIPLNQLNDRPLFFPALQLKTALFDKVVKALANYSDMAALSMDTYHMATNFAYAAYRAVYEAKELGLANIELASNVVKVTRASIYDENYMVKVYNELDVKMAEGDPLKQAMTFNGTRQIIGKPEFITWSKSPKTGYISNYSDIGQSLLLEPNFDLGIASQYGSQYRGNVKGYMLTEANQQVFTYVEKWLGITAGTLSKVLGIVFTPMAYASGGAFTEEISLLQSTVYNGLVAFPFHKFGGTAYRKTFVIVESDFTFPALLTGSIANPVLQPRPIIAPSEFGVKAVTVIENTLSKGPSVAVQNPFPKNLPIAYSIAGKTVSGTNVGLVGVTVTATNEFGQAFEATTAADGTYTIENVTGTVTVIPTKAGLATKIPAQQVVSYQGTNVTGIDFVMLA
jgi:hypothetical protein